MGIEHGPDLSTFGHGVQVTGRSQTRISTGSRVQTPAGAIFTVISDVTIPPGGVATIDIKSQGMATFACRSGISSSSTEQLDGPEQKSSPPLASIRAAAK
ncbi:hypothetical protein WP1_222 [Pseudomonas phage WP1]